MTIRIQNGMDETQKRIIGESGALVGLMTQVTGTNNWRVEMFNGLDVTQSNYDRAVGFVYGVTAVSRK